MDTESMPGLGVEPPGDNPRKLGSFYAHNVWWCLLITAVLTLLLWMLFLAIIPQAGRWVDLSTAMVIGIVLGGWLRMTATSSRERNMDPKDVQVFRFEEPSAAYMQKLKRLMKSSKGKAGGQDINIRACTREHKWFLYMRVGIPDVLTFCIVVLTIASMLGHIYFPWPAAVVLVGLTIAARWLASLGWRIKTLTALDDSLREDKWPPVWIPLWNPDPKIIFYDKINEVDPRPSFWGNFFGKLLGPGKTWGTIVITLSNDEPIEFPRIPNYIRYANVINELRRSDRWPERIEEGVSRSEVVQYLQRHPEDVTDILTEAGFDVVQHDQD